MLPEVRVARVLDAITSHRAGRLSGVEAGELLGFRERRFRWLPDVFKERGEGLCNLSSGNCIERCSRILPSPLYICLCVSDPFFIDFDEDGANEPHERVFIREDPHFGCASF